MDDRIEALREAVEALREAGRLDAGAEAAMEFSCGLIDGWPKNEASAEDQTQDAERRANAEWVRERLGLAEGESLQTPTPWETWLGEILPGGTDAA